MAQDFNLTLSQWPSPGKNLVNTHVKTQKALEEMVSSESNCRPDVVSNRSSCRARCGVEQINFSNPMWCRADQEACTRTRGGAAWSCRPDVVSSGSSKVKPENPKEVESVAEKVLDKVETIEENDERITNEKFSEHIGRRGMVLRSVLMSSPRRSSKTLNPGDMYIFKTRKSMTEQTCVRSRSQSFRRKSPRP